MRIRCIGMLMFAAVFLLTDRGYSQYHNCGFFNHRVWPGGTITYRIDESTLPEGWSAAIRRAALDWNGVSTGFQLVESSQSPNVVYGGSLGIPDPPALPIGATTIVWANTQLCNSELSVINTRTTEINTDIGFYVDVGMPPSNLWDLQTIMDHEFGHWVEFSDNLNTESIMLSPQGPGNSPGITPDCVTDLNNIYGPIISSSVPYSAPITSSVTLTGAATFSSPGQHLQIGPDGTGIIIRVNPGASIEVTNGTTLELDDPSFLLAAASGVQISDYGDILVHSGSCTQNVGVVTGLCTSPPCTPGPPRHFDANIVGQDVVLNWDPATPDMNIVWVIVYVDNAPVILPPLTGSYSHQNGVGTLPHSYQVVFEGLNGLGPFSEPINVNTSPSTIAQATVWAGLVYVPSGISVNSGVTLTIQPGTKIRTASGGSSYLQIYGTLNAQGSTVSPISFDRAGTSGSWGGLAYQSGSSGTVSYCNFSNANTDLTSCSSNATISNCTFSNSTGGITCSGASPTINGCTFLSNYFGIYLVNSSPMIEHCDIENSTNSGMYLSNSAPTIQYNTLKNNQESGIWFHNFSSPSNIYHNNISGSSEGFYCDYQSSPQAPYGCNAINSGWTQVYAYYGCLPVLGSAYNSGLNSFDGSPYTYVNANSSSVVTAVYNWWGTSSPNPSLFYADATSSVVWSPPDLSDPNPGRPKIEIQSPTPTPGPYADSTFNLAYQAYQAGRYADAISNFLKVYQASTSTPSLEKQALLFLADAYERDGQTDFLAYLTRNISPKASNVPDLALVSRELQAHWLLKSGRYADAIGVEKEITLAFGSNVDASKFALFNLGEMYNFYVNDPISAKSTLLNFLTKYPDDRLAAVANFLISTPSATFATPKQVGGGSVGPASAPPTSFALDSNYPNPFNPSTKISYSLPEAGHVSLVIYDVLGREIMKLADGHQETGRYTVTWNSTQTSGMPVSSGVYFARLRVMNDLGRVTFTKTTRLLLMK